MIVCFLHFIYLQGWCNLHDNEKSLKLILYNTIVIHWDKRRISFLFKNISKMHKKLLQKRFFSGKKSIELNWGNQAAELFLLSTAFHYQLHTFSL